MGCTTTLILVSEHPDLYAGHMFVDGQLVSQSAASLGGGE